VPAIVVTHDRMEAVALGDWMAVMVDGRIRQTGPVQMPSLLFADDLEWHRGFAFCTEALRHGAYFHPKHNMFLSCAHTEADIDHALAAADAAFRTVS